MPHTNYFSEEFGVELAAFESERKTEQAFIGTQVGAALGYKNVRKAIRDCGLTQGIDYVMVKYAGNAKTKAFFEEARNCGLLPSASNQITVLYESGFWKLAMFCTLPQAAKFRDWLSRDVLPSIRKTGGYALPANAASLQAHLSHRVQKDNTIAAGAKIYRQTHNAKDIQDHHREITVALTGKPPSEWRAIAKSAGLKSRACASARETLRQIAPVKACQISIAEKFFADGAEQTVAVEIGAAAAPVFALILKAGFVPAELKQLKMKETAR